MRRSLPLLLATLLFTGCAGGQGRAPLPEPAPAEEPAPKSETAAAASASPAQAQTAPARSPGAPASTPAAETEVAPEAATGTSHLELAVSKPFEMAGFELHLRVLRPDLKAAAPQASDQIQGMLCADNPDIPGGFKYICATVPARQVSGRLALVPVSWSGKPPALADIDVQKIDLVDVDSRPAPEGTELTLRLVD